MLKIKRKISEKGEIVIPKELRKEIDLRAGTEVIVSIQNDYIKVERAKDPMKILNEFFNLAEKSGFKYKTLSPNKIKELIDSEYEERYNSYMGLKK